jgi:DNA polymerase III subunit delta'
MIIGHEKIVAQLSEHAENGSLAHAHLFIGPKHVGKTRVALELAVILQEATESPVLRKQVLEGRDADTMLLLDDGENLSIKAIRDVRVRATQSHARPHLVVIIENIGRMKVEALNALLKTLEEPPEGAVFFLTAHREEDIIPTIRSRCQITQFTTVHDAALKEVAEGSELDLLVMYAMGRPGKLKRLQQDAEYFEAHKTVHQGITQFLEKPSVPAAFSLVRQYEKDENLHEFLDILLHRTRTLALSGQVPPVLQGLDFASLLEKTELSKDDLRGNVNKKLILETLLLSFVS